MQTALQKSALDSTLESAGLSRQHASLPEEERIRLYTKECGLLPCQHASLPEEERFRLYTKECGLLPC